MSRHDQGPCAVQAAVSALATDGIIEAVEHTDHPFCLRVRWHPEATAATDASQQKIFDALLETGLS